MSEGFQEQLPAESAEKTPVQRYERLSDSFIAGWRDYTAAVDAAPEYYPQSISLRSEMMTTGLSDEEIAKSPGFHTVAGREWASLYGELDEFTEIPEEEKEKIRGKIGAKWMSAWHKRPPKGR